jgi:hypothetical protein
MMPKVVARLPEPETTNDVIGSLKTFQKKFSFSQLN